MKWSSEKMKVGRVGGERKKKKKKRKQLGHAWFVIDAVIGRFAWADGWDKRDCHVSTTDPILLQSEAFSTQPASQREVLRTQKLKGVQASRAVSIGIKYKLRLRAVFFGRC